MGSVLGSAVLTGAWCLLVGAGSSVATYRLWRGRASVGTAWGLTGVGLSGLLGFVVLWLAPAAATVIGVLLPLAGLAAVIVRAPRRRWIRWLPPILLVAATGLVCIGFLYLWGATTDPWALARWRFGWGPPTPDDNRLSALFVDTLGSGRSTHAMFLSWNGSDRPPLLAGFITLVRPLTSMLAIDPAAAALGIGIAVQLLWIPALHSLCRAWGASRGGAILGVAAAAVLGVVVVNTVYTWPKMLSAALILVAATILFDRRGSGRVPRAAAAGVAVALSALAHGAALFALPLVALLALRWIRADRSAGRRATALGAMAGAAVIAYLPWTLYQRFVDPPGDRLLKYHLAGVQPIDDRSAVKAIIDSYARITPEEWLATRIADLRTIFPLDPLQGLGSLDWQTVAERRFAEYYRTTCALGVWFPLAIIVLVAVLTRLARRKADRLDRAFAATIALGLLAMLIWSVVMFEPDATVVHQGTIVWILLVAAATVIWIHGRSPLLAVAAIAVQAVATGLVYLVSPISSTLSAPALIATAGGCAGAAACAAVLAVRRRAAHPSGLLWGRGRGASLDIRRDVHAERRAVRRGADQEHPRPVGRA